MIAHSVKKLTNRELIFAKRISIACSVSQASTSAQDAFSQAYSIALTTQIPARLCCQISMQEKLAEDHIDSFRGSFRRGNTWKKAVVR